MHVEPFRWRRPRTPTRVTLTNFDKRFVQVGRMMAAKLCDGFPSGGARRSSGKRRLGPPSWKSKAMGSARLKWESPVRMGALPRRHTCISEPLDKPRALASSGVRPFFSVLLTDEGKETRVRSLTPARANAARHAAASYVTCG